MQIGLMDYLCAVTGGSVYYYCPELTSQYGIAMCVYYGGRGLTKVFSKYRSYIPGTIVCLAESTALWYTSYNISRVAEQVSQHNSVLGYVARLLGRGFKIGAWMGVTFGIVGVVIGYNASRLLSPYINRTRQFLGTLSLEITSALNDNREITMRVINGLINQGTTVAQSREVIETAAPLRCRGLSNDQGQEESRTCAVCLEDFGTQELHRVLPCRHAFHAGCIDRWFTQHLNCPMCRKGLVTEPHET